MTAADGSRTPGGRHLRPPGADTPLDRAWRRRRWRLERAHDDWGLHIMSGDPRAPIHRASGLARLRREAVRDRVRAYRRMAEATGLRCDAAAAGRAIADAVAAYRSAISELAQAVADFAEQNRAVSAGLLSGSEVSAGHRTASDPVAGAHSRATEIEEACP